MLIKGFSSQQIGDAYAKDNKVTFKVDRNDYQMGESLDIDTPKVRITGEVVWTLGKYVTIKITKLLHKENIN